MPRPLAPSPHRRLLHRQQQGRALLRVLSLARCRVPRPSALRPLNPKRRRPRRPPPHLLMPMCLPRVVQAFSIPSRPPALPRPAPVERQMQPDLRSDFQTALRSMRHRPRPSAASLGDRAHSRTRHQLRRPSPQRMVPRPSARLRPMRCLRRRFHPLGQAQHRALEHPPSRRPLRMTQRLHTRRRRPLHR